MHMDSHAQNLQGDSLRTILETVSDVVRLVDELASVINYFGTIVIDALTTFVSFAVSILKNNIFPTLNAFLQSQNISLTQVEDYLTTGFNLTVNETKALQEAANITTIVFGNLGTFLWAFFSLWRCSGRGRLCSGL